MNQITDRRIALQWLAAPLLFACAPLLQAQDKTALPRYSRSASSAGGTGKFYMGREIAGIMSFQNAAWLEREEREREERGDLLMHALALRAGMTAADVGAGSGYYTRRMARLVGSTGSVYALDVQPEMLQMLSQRAKKEGLSNIKPVLSTAQDVKLPAASLDLAIMVDVYHELEFPFEFMQTLVAALKPGGRLVFVEYRAEDAKVPILPVHKMSETQIRREAALHALAYERTAGVLPWQHVVVFRKV